MFVGGVAVAMVVAVVVAMAVARGAFCLSVHEVAVACPLSHSQLHLHLLRSRVYALMENCLRPSVLRLTLQTPHSLSVRLSTLSCHV